MAMSKMPVSEETLILASIADNLSFIAWTKTKDAEKGRNRPKSLVQALIGKEESEKHLITFGSAEEFEKAKARIIEKGEG